MSANSDSGEMWRAIDLVCDAYETARKSGLPDLDDYLGSVSDVWKSHLKLELEAIDRSYRDLDDSSPLDFRRADDDTAIDFVSSEPSIAAGQLWKDRFKVKKRLGVGSAGTVWLAFDQRLSRKVALKVPHGNLAGAQNELRIANEAKAIAAVSHPGIVQIHEVITERNATILVEQYVDGLPLSHKINDDTALAFSAIVQWAIQIADALAHAHEHGVIHRDLKPGNIMIQRGNPVILDFGMASCRDGLARLTAAGTILGTPAYMSPEQAIGKPTGSKFATDIYSFGAILYELLTGAPPFRGTMMEILKSVRFDHPVPPRRIRSSIPRDLETITLRCLSKSPGSRYASVADLRDDLERLQKRQPIRARKVSWLELGWVWCRQRPVQSLLLLLLPIILGLSSGWLASSRQRSELHSRSVELLSDQKLNSEKRQELEKQMAFIRLSRASQELARGDQKRASVFLNETPNSQRGWEWQLLWALSRDESDQLDHKGLEPVGFTISAICYDSTSGQLFSGSHAGTVAQWSPSEQSNEKNSVTNPHTLVSKAIARESSSIRDLQTSTNGRWLAWSTKEGDAVLYEISSGKERFRWSFKHNVRANTVCFAPTGNQLIIAGGGSVLMDCPKNARRSWIKLASLESSNFGDIIDEVYGTPAEQVTAVTYASPGNILVAKGDQEYGVATQQFGSVTRFDVSSDQLIETEVIWQGQSLADIDYSAAAELATWCDSAGLVNVYDLENDRLIGQINGSQEPLHCIEFSDDGTQIIVGGQDGVVRRWDVSTRMLIRRYQGHRQPVLGVAHNKIFNSSSLSPLEAGHEHQTVPNETPLADNEQVISCGSDGKIRIWHRGGRFREDSIQIACRALTNAKWSKDGKTIFVTTREDFEGRGSNSFDKPFQTIDMSQLGNLKVRQHQLEKSGIEVRQFSSPNMRTSPIGVSGENVSFCIRDRMFLIRDINQDQAHVFNLSRASNYSLGVTGNSFAVSFLGPSQKTKSSTPLTQPSDALLSLHDFSSQRTTANQSVPGIGLSQLAKLSPDENFIAVCCHVTSRLSIVRVSPKNEEAPFARIFEWRPHHWAISDLAWSHDGKHLATCSWDGTVAWWKHSFGDSDPEAELIYRLQASNRPLTSVSISPGQQYLATCGDDRIIRLWNLENGCELLSFPPQSTSVATVQFSPDGANLLIALSNGRLKVMPLSINDQ